MGTPRYPAIEAQLTGTDGNAFAVMGAVLDALRKNGVPAFEIEAFSTEAMSGDYDKLLRTCCAWVEVA